MDTAEFGEEERVDVFGLGTLQGCRDGGSVEDRESVRDVGGHDVDRGAGPCQGGTDV